MELKLEHIVGYLPYGLKMQYIVRDVVERVGTMTSISHNESETHPTRIGIDWYDEEHIWMFKPLLLPLSSLTKEIEHNGEKFVPMYKLWELCGFEIGRGQYIKIHPNCLITSNFGTAHEFRINISDITSSNYNVILKLYEWHFDIHNLIPNNLAIDKSKI